MKKKELKMYGREVKVTVLRDGGTIPQGAASPQTIYDYYLNFIQKASWFNLDQECLVLLCLDVKRQIKDFQLIYLGGLTQTICHPRDIFRPAIVGSAHSIVLVHNHPSGDPTPSKNDCDMTKRIEDAGKLLLIPLFDHVIMGDKGRFYSFRESGVII